MSTDPGSSVVPNVTYVRCDLRDPDAVGKLLREHDIEAVVNTAALSQPAQCEADASAARCVYLSIEMIAGEHSLVLA